ncbi:hypothetical protein B6N60_03601 [Richelia sinica FACHB-800]|uniref:Galactose oxidase n=1 Tax=Richelia sinica FACHB-800 TaxID=1357546 RepID=A0A975T9V4_9NOST|nr:kelch-like protein [Richelia sinica]MBD2663996.1 hypothetical protein [Richelia sinica FACHB-800]QXE24891.1 hypothetical protein B6N60_03601 [Richelia sinica FACHB-800]
MNITTPQFIWKKPKITGRIPRPRHGHSAICYNNSMIIFGGTNIITDKSLKDVHVLDLTTWKWTKPKVTGQVPSPRSYHTAVLYQDKMLVWGGYKELISSSFKFNDVYLHILDLKTWRWSKMTPMGTLPEARSHHSAVIFQDKLIIHGGAYDIYASFNDLYILDLRKKRWLPVELELCHPVALPGLKVHGNTLIRFFGDGAYQGFCSDVLTLDLTNLDFTKPLKLSFQPANFQAIENYSYKVPIPPDASGDEEEMEDDYFDDDEEDIEDDYLGDDEEDEDIEDDYLDDDEEIVDFGDGIPYRTIHSYGEFGNNLVLYAGVAPGNGVSHATINDLVMLHLPSHDEANTGTYTGLIPQVEGQFPPPRFGHSTIQFHQQMIIFGGIWLDTYCGNHQHDNDVYILESLEKVL